MVKIVLLGSNRNFIYPEAKFSPFFTEKNLNALNHRKTFILNDSVPSKLKSIQLSQQEHPVMKKNCVNKLFSICDNDNFKTS